jgi:hypothetical protein
MADDLGWKAMAFVKHIRVVGLTVCHDPAYATSHFSQSKATLPFTLTKNRKLEQWYPGLATDKSADWRETTMAA